MSLVQINWKPDRKELRKFGWAMIGGFGLIGAVFYLGLWPIERPSAGVAYLLWAFGAAAGVLGWSGTTAALPVYWAWMSIAFVMGNIMSRIVLIIFWFLVMTPFGLLMRLTGRDRLHLRRRGAKSYWCDIKGISEKTDYERQF